MNLTRRNFLAALAVAGVVSSCTMPETGVSLGASRPQFYPSQYGTLLYRWDELVTGDSQISTWTDAVAGKTLTATSSHQPALQGEDPDFKNHPSVGFSSGLYLTSPDAAATYTALQNDCTIVLVFEPEHSASAAVQMMLSTTESTNFPGIQVFFQGSRDLQNLRVFWSGTGTGKIGDLSSHQWSVPRGQQTIAIITRSGSAVTIEIVDAVEADGSATLSGDTTGNAHAALRLGAQAGSLATSQFTGRMGGVYVFSSVSDLDGLKAALKAHFQPPKVTDSDIVEVYIHICASNQITGQISELPPELQAPQYGALRWLRSGLPAVPSGLEMQRACDMEAIGGICGSEITLIRDLVAAGRNAIVFKYEASASALNDHWQVPSGISYADFLSKLSDFLLTLNAPVEFKGLIFDIGYLDATITGYSAHYQANQQALQSAIRTVCKFEKMPVLTVRLHQNVTLPFAPQIRAAQDAIVAADVIDGTQCGFIINYDDQPTSSTIQPNHPTTAADIVLGEREAAQLLAVTVAGANP